MFELIYPLEPAPMFLSGSHDGKGSEVFPVVEETGLVVGRASRDYCHGGSMLLHPVVHLHIIDRFGRIYLQKRSEKKDIQPGKWDTAVGGHVAYGESLSEALFREAREEIGFKDFNPVYICSYVFISEIESELVNVFAAAGNFVLYPDRDEVDEGKYWEQKEIEESFGKSVLTPNFEGEYTKIKDRLCALL